MLNQTFEPKASIILLLTALVVMSLVGCGKNGENKAEDKLGKVLPTSAKATPSAGLPVTESSASTASADNKDAPTSVPVDFVDVAGSVGLNFQFHADIVPGRFLIVEALAGTMAWFDYDLDGSQDLYLLNGNVVAEPSPDIQNQLFQNVGGTFRHVDHHGSGDTGYGYGVAVGDFDVDGFPDLYIGNYGPNALYHNNGDGTFERIESDVLADSDWSAGCVWFDANGDRLPDLFVGNYGEVTIESNEICYFDGRPAYCGPNVMPPQQDRVLINNGDSTFRDGTREFGFVVDPVYTLGVMAVDLNDDAVPEIVAARDLTPNGLFVRGEDGQWKDSASPAGVATDDRGRQEAGMGIACADFDGDHKFDFMLTHYYEKKNTLYRNLGDLNFFDDSYRSRVAAVSEQFLGFGISVLDINRDGAPDLFIANGHVLGPNSLPNKMTPQIYLNDGKGRFSDVSERCGPYFKRLLLGRGSATADFDNDGDHDIAVGHIQAPMSLLEDRMPNRNWIGLSIVSSDRGGTAGGHVIVNCGDSSRKVPLKAGSSYLCEEDPRILVALPDGTDAVDVTVVYPGGNVQKSSGLLRNQYWRISEESVAPAVW